MTKHRQKSSKEQKRHNKQKKRNSNIYIIGTIVELKRKNYGKYKYGDKFKVVVNGKHKGNNIIVCPMNSNVNKRICIKTKYIRVI